MEKISHNIHIDWESLRGNWPFFRRLYWVYDCIENIYGKAFYDGIQFEEPEWETSKKSSLLLHQYRVSHWACIDFDRDIGQCDKCKSFSFFSKKEKFECWICRTRKSQENGKNG